MLNENPFVKIRRELHLIPEIGLEEYKTHEYLMKKNYGFATRAS